MADRLCPRCLEGRLGPRQRICDACVQRARRDRKARRAREMAAARKAQAARERQMAASAGPRVCLSCDRTFPSEGPWNRICPKCSGGDRRSAVRGRAHDAGRDGLRSIAITTSHHPCSKFAWPSGGGRV